MKRLDDDKVSLVDFLRSIKFTSKSDSNQALECHTHFASFEQHARRRASAEDSQVVRSAN